MARFIPLNVIANNKFSDDKGNVVDIPDDVFRLGGKGTETRALLILNDDTPFAQPIGEPKNAVLLPYSGDDILTMANILLGAVGGVGALPAGISALGFINDVALKINQVIAAGAIPTTPLDPSFFADVATTTTGLQETEASLTEFTDNIG